MSAADSLYYPSRRRGRAESDETGDTIRCDACKRVSRAVVWHVWDDECNFEAFVSECACGSDCFDVLPGAPCERCDCNPVTRLDTDYCDSCDIALELDDVIGGIRLQRAWDDLHQPMPCFAGFVRDITMLQQVRT